MKTFAIIGNLFWLSALGVMFWADGLFVQSLAELIMVIIMLVVPTFNIITLYRIQSPNGVLGLSNTWLFLFIKRRRLEEQQKIIELETRRSEI